MKPTVSVVVPARNEEEMIGACLESILRQEPPPHEVILVDNGSTDRTGEIGRSLGVRVVYQPNPACTSPARPASRPLPGKWWPLPMPTAG